MKKIKEQCKNLPFLTLSSDEDNLILKIDASKEVWGTVLKIENNQICRYTSRIFSEIEKDIILMKKKCLLW